MKLAAPAVVALTAVAFAGTPASGEPPAPPPPALTPAQLVEQRAPTVVSLKYVFRGSNKEHPREAQGTVVDPSGLVMVSNSYFTWSGGSVAQIRVLFGNDPKEWSSVIVARDSILDLAYVQVLGLEKQPVAAVDLARGADVHIGADLLSVWRARRGFDFAPGFSKHYVRGRIEKPRAMWSLGGERIAPGVPVYDESGRPVGVTSNQRGSESEDDGESSSRRTFLLPLDEAVKSLELARKRVPEALKKAAEEEPAPDGAAAAPAPAPQSEEPPK